MTRDFTFEMYEKLLEAGLDAGYEHLTIREYLSDDNLPEQFIIHRHDVDRKPENALTMAKLEAEYDISSTYYFRTIKKTLKPDIILEIEELGHEIGYHYEDLDRANGDVEAARSLFANNLENLRDWTNVETVCMHGNPLTSYDNRDLWDDGHYLEKFGLLGEAYISMDFDEVTYFSDTGRTWMDGPLKIKDHTMGGGTKTVAASSTNDLIEILQLEDIRRGCILSHPNRWARDLSEYLVEYSKDAIVNVGKRGLNMLS